EIKDWKEENIESEVREMANQLNLKGKQIIHPTRVSLSGKTIGPGLFSLMEALGKEINIKRLEKTIHKLNKN
ncbi:MAG: glutamate--tRNA ligase, partial [Candidatus Caldatribacteriota bacterium]